MTPEQMLYLHRDLVELNNRRNDALAAIGTEFSPWWSRTDERLPVEPTFRETLDEDELSLLDLADGAGRGSGGAVGPAS